MKRRIAGIAVCLLIALFGVGCENEEGSAEKAGKEIDKAYKKAEKEVNKTIDKLKEKAEELKE